MAAVGAVCAWQLWSLRASTRPVSYPFDASVHLQMARYATAAISRGRLPLTSWFPYIDLGSAQFLHYQSLAAMLTGLAGTVAGPGNAFRWSLYLLLSLWPVAVYSSARLAGIPRLPAVAAAVASPLVASRTGVGFEQGAYLWSGGAELWTQLWGSWALPFAWAASWRALQQRRYVWVAAGLVALTTALHFESGYLAFLGVMVVTLAGPGRLGHRLARGATLFATSLAAAAWVVAPLMAMSRWAALNSVLATTYYVRGYGARQTLAWLFSGQVFDARHLVPATSLAVLAGAAWAAARWRRDPLARALLALFGASLALSFGPTTWGPLADLVPAHGDLYFRRFLMGAQLSGLYLAGMGATALGRWARRALGAAPRRAGNRLAAALAQDWGLVLGCACGLALLGPAFSHVARNDRLDASLVNAQASADLHQGRLIAPLIGYIRHHGGGRAYAGLVDNWGYHFTVGYVPVYRYLEAQDIDETAYVVPTSSLMLGPEFYFDQDDPRDYPLFGVRYLLLPRSMASPVASRRVMVSGPYALWVVPGSGYVSPVEVTGAISADRADVASRSAALLSSGALPLHVDWAVRWPGGPAPLPSAPPAATGQPPGAVRQVDVQLARGQLSAQVVMHRPGALLVSVAFDPGWRATVDGRPAPVDMLAPAVMGVQLGAGHHRVQFSYHGYRWYPELAALGALALAGASWWGRRGRGLEPAATAPTGQLRAPSLGPSAQPGTSQPGAERTARQPAQDLADETGI